MAQLKEKKIKEIKSRKKESKDGEDSVNKGIEYRDMEKELAE